MNRLLKCIFCIINLLYFKFFCCTAIFAQTTPSNDLICNAQVIVIDDTLNPTIGSLLGANFQNLTGIAPSSNSLSDIWYKFTATQQSQILILQAGNGYLPQLDVLKGIISCTSNPTQQTGILLTASSNTNGGLIETTINGLTPGSLYYIRVSHLAIYASPTYSFRLILKSPPTNDLCNNASYLNDNQLYSGTCLGASPSTIPSCYPNFTNDVWYKFTADNPSTNIVITTTNSSDCAFSVHSSCTSDPIACINYSGANQRETLALTDLVNGQSYYVRVYTADNNVNKQFSISRQNYYTPTGNDRVQQATSLPLNTVTTGGSTQYYATVTSYGMQMGEPKGNTWSNHPTVSQWFKFTPNSTNCYTIASKGSGNSTLDTQQAIYTATNVDDFSSFVQIASDDDSGSNIGNPALSSQNSLILTQGTTYYIQVNTKPYTYGTVQIFVSENASNNLIQSTISSISNINCTEATLHFNHLGSAPTCILEIATDSLFQVNYGSIQVGTSIQQPLTNLISGSAYYTRFSYITACGIQTDYIQGPRIITLAPPATPTQMIMPTSVCPGQKNILFSVPSDPQVAQYSWSMPNGWTNVSNSNNSTTITVDLAINPTAGNISVTSHNHCGASLPLSVPVPSFNTGNSINQTSKQASCLVNQDDFIHFFKEGQLLASIHPKNQNLGIVSVESFFDIEPIQIQNCAGTEMYVLNRRWHIEPTTTNEEPVTVRLYFEKEEFDHLQAKALESLTTIDDLSSMYDLLLSKYSGTNENGLFSDNCGHGTITQHNFNGQLGMVSTLESHFSTSTYYMDFEVSDFSEFWLHGHTGNSSLPIVLKSFELSCQSNKVELTWNTLSERNNAYFTLEKSRDLITWHEVTQVASKGESNNSQTYYFQDHFDANMRYYRISQTDLDGKVTKLETESITCESNLEELQVYPNPSTGAIKITHSIPIQHLAIYDMKGILIKHISGESTQFTGNSIKISLDMLQGIYLLEAKDNEGRVYTQKIIIE